MSKAHMSGVEAADETSLQFTFGTSSQLTMFNEILLLAVEPGVKRSCENLNQTSPLPQLLCSQGPKVLPSPQPPG